MRNLKNKVAVIPCIFLIACATSYYRQKQITDMIVAVQLTPDRISYLCVNPSEDPVRWMLILYLLDEDRKVVTSVFEFKGYQKDCERKVEEIQRVASSGTSVLIAGIGDLKGKKEYPDEVEFIKHGRFRESGAQFAPEFIQSDSGLCHNFWVGTGSECQPENYRKLILQFQNKFPDVK